MKKPRLLIAEDHPIVVEGLRRLLEDDFDIVGVVSDGRALVEETRAMRPDVVVADVSMPNLGGLEALEHIVRNPPLPKVVMLSMHQNPLYARRALDAGASGYVVKHAAPAELVLAINAALRDGVFVSPLLAKDVYTLRKTKDAAERTLTVRQREVLRLLVEGLTAKQAAERLAVSPRTIEFHKYEIMRTHDLHSAGDLVRFAIRNGVSPA